jgi:hypothetical protein
MKQFTTNNSPQQNSPQTIHQRQFIEDDVEFFLGETIQRRRFITEKFTTGKFNASSKIKPHHETVHREHFTIAEFTGYDSS